MFLFRIGKEKWAYTLTMSIHKLKYSDVASLSHNQLIEIRTRGNHELTYLSSINKRGQIIPDKRTQSIPMTLYYDKDDKTFDRKEMIIKGRVLDQLREVETQLGQAQLNIAEYAKEQGVQKFLLEVEIENNPKQVCKIKFNVTVQRNLDAKQTICDHRKENMETTTQNASEKDQKRSRMSVSKGKSKLKQSSIKQNTIKQELSEKNSQYSVRSQLKMPQQKLDKTEPRNILKQFKQQSRLEPEQPAVTNKSISPKAKEFEPRSEDNDTVVLGRNTPPKLVHTTSVAYTTQLKLYQAEKKLKAKQTEVQRLRKMLEDQEKINLVLVQQQRKQYNYKQSLKLTKEVAQLKTQLEVANMKISELESANRTYLDRIERSQLASDKMGQQIVYYKSLLEKEKLKVAELLQKALETGDTNLIAFVEETFAEE